MTYHEKLLALFNGDAKKASLWMNARNPNLGDASPNELIEIGLGDKLDSFIDHGLSNHKHIENQDD